MTHTITRRPKILSYQAGVETGALKYFWLKVSAFRHDVSDAIVQEFITDPIFIYTLANKDNVRRQGFEAEIKTLPFYNFTFSAGAYYTWINNLSDDDIVRDYPKYSYSAGIRYDDEKTLKALLTGRYVWWDSVREGNYSGAVIDLSIMKKIYRQNDREAEIFLTAHNLFDVEQHLSSPYRYADRWIEAGLRYRF